MDVLWQELIFGLSDRRHLAVVLIRVIAAILLGAIVGIQRERAGKPAGLRTHMLVSLGTAVFVLECVEKVVIPLVDQHRDKDEAQIEGHDGREQTARGPSFFGKPVRLGERPDLTQERPGSD